MKASDLRLGNFAGVCYEDTFVPDEVIVLEPGVVHLSKRKYPDDERDIVGVPISEDWLSKFDFDFDTDMGHWVFKNIFIQKSTFEPGRYWVWQSNSIILKITFVHELQNLLYTLSEVS